LKIVDADKNTIKKLRDSGLSTSMKSLEFCKFLVIEEHDEKIIGASGIGGLLNIHSIEINKNYRGKGLGKKLFSVNIEEAKKRGYSFILGSTNPENIPVVKLYSFLGFSRLFRIHYSHGIVTDAKILVLKPKGRIIEKLLNLINTKIGMFAMAVTVKVAKSSFRGILTLSPNEFPDPSILYIVRNFEKV